MNRNFHRIKESLSQNFKNIPGWRSNRKIVVIESDDWGSIRMPSNDVYSKFISRGFNLSGSDYNRIDSLESNDDLALLYEVLSRLKDSEGNNPAFTANIVVGNPDFGKIRKSDFNEYFFEPVTETLKRYNNHDKIEMLWKEGNSRNIFHPQFHGREHVNVMRWMNALRTGSPDIMFTFDNETTFSGDGDYNFMEVLDYNTPDELGKMKESLREGLDLFENIFGYKSKSFIPPCYTWNSEIEETIHLKGVKYIQGIIVQLIPTGSFGNYRKKYHFLGNRNYSGQIFLIRNCFFEPALTKTSDPVGDCLRSIDTAFRWGKPAVISSHRINYIGTLDPSNRSKNLKLLNSLLYHICRNWPDVEFMTSDRLGDLIAII